MKLNKSKIIMALTSLLMVGGLVGCGGEATSHSSRVKKEKIKFLHIWSECSQEMTKIVNDFMSENPNIEVEVIVSDYTNISTYLNNQILSHSLPDVFFYWSNQVGGYVQMDVVEPLNNYMDGWKETFINNGEAWDLSKVGDKYYSVPFRCTGEMIVYNKTLFEEHNITYPTNIQEFEDTLVSLRKITTNPSFSPMCVSGISGGSLVKFYTAFQNFQCLLCESYKDPAYSTGLLEDDDESRTLEGRMLDKLKDWNNKGYFGQADGKTKDTTIRNFLEGNAAMIQLNNNNLYLLNDLEDVELGYGTIPAPRGLDYTYVPSDFDGFSISKESRHKEAAAKFLKYLTSKQVGQYFTEKTDSIMAVDGIEYKNDVQREINVALKDCGKGEFTQNDVQYSTSNINDKNSEAILKYILGKSKYTSGKEVVDFIWNNYLTAITDAGLKPVKRTIPKLTADFSWLDIRQ